MDDTLSLRHCMRSRGGENGVAKGVAVHDQEAITESARAERQRRVEDAIHSNEMEGLHVNADTLADADEYVAGRIDSDELVARARARYGLG
jgi:Antitoxin VbhA